MEMGWLSVEMQRRLSLNKAILICVLNKFQLIV